MVSWPGGWETQDHSEININHIVNPANHIFVMSSFGNN